MWRQKIGAARASVVAAWRAWRQGARLCRTRPANSGRAVPHPRGASDARFGADMAAAAKPLLRTSRRRSAARSPCCWGSHCDGPGLVWSASRSRRPRCGRRDRRAGAAVRRQGSLVSLGDRIATRGVRTAVFAQLREVYPRLQPVADRTGGRCGEARCPISSRRVNSMALRCPTHQSAGCAGRNAVAGSQAAGIGDPLGADGRSSAGAGVRTLRHQLVSMWTAAATGPNIGARLGGLGTPALHLKPWSSRVR